MSSNNAQIEKNTSSCNITPFPGNKENANSSSLTLPYDSYITTKNFDISSEKQSFPNEDNYMNDNELLKTYMDKVDRDQRDLKTEMRERETRIDKNLQESERRIDEKLERIEKLISEQNKNYNEKIDKLSNKFDNSVAEIKSNKLQIIALIIATILSVAAVAIAAIQVVQGFISIFSSVTSTASTFFTLI